MNGARNASYVLLGCVGFSPGSITNGAVRGSHVTPAESLERRTRDYGQ